METTQIQEGRRLEWWKKPPIDPYLLGRLREKLSLSEGFGSRRWT